MALEKVSANRVANGTLTKYKFPSSSLGNLETNVNVFVPDGADAKPVPVLFYLAGLTCTEDTAAQKGGMFNAAGKHHIALVFPDTSPRGAGVEGEDDDWQLGTGECLCGGVEGVGGGVGGGEVGEGLGGGCCGGGQKKRAGSCLATTTTRCRS